MKKTGILIINLGTPDNCDVQSVRRYLKEFLSDPRVIDIPAPARWLLLHAFILPTRPKQSAAAYQKIWSTSGSPLLVNTQNLQTALSKKLSENYRVTMGMRYGNPSIETALQDLEDCSDLLILPLFPQYSSAATGSALEKTLNCLSKQWNIPSIKVIHEFYRHPSFIRAYADVINQHIHSKKIDKLIFSYHGLPQRHIKKSQCQATCDYSNSCPTISVKNQYCYRAQCYATSQAIAAHLGLSNDEYIVAFQSRLGRTPWIKPYTDELLPTLIKQNVKRIAVVCPSFVADCLETIEEIGMRGKEQWENLGGETFLLIPCLNDQPIWVDAVTDMILQTDVI